MKIYKNWEKSLQNVKKRLVVSLYPSLSLESMAMKFWLTFAYKNSINGQNVENPGKIITYYSKKKKFPNSKALPLIFWKSDTKFLFTFIRKFLTRKIINSLGTRTDIYSNRNPPYETWKKESFPDQISSYFFNSRNDSFEISINLKVKTCVKLRTLE